MKTMNSLVIASSFHLLQLLPFFAVVEEETVEKKRNNSALSYYVS